MSYSATSSKLSDAFVYPMFTRTPPTDALQAQVISHFVDGIMDWGYAVTLSGDDAYSQQGISDFKKYGIDAGLKVALSQQFVTGTNDVSVQLKALKNTKVKLIVCFAQAVDMVTILKEAKKLGMRGSDGYTWI